MIYEIFKAPNSNRAEFSIISESGNVYYFPQILTITEVEEVLYALYGEHVNWTATSKRNFSTEEFENFGYELSNYAAHYPEKMLLEIFNSNNLRAYAEEIFNEVLWYDIQDAKER